jgi:hypothetical protein
MKDPVLGPLVMRKVAKVWKNGCCYAEINEAEHFAQERGEQVARLVIGVFEKQGKINGRRRLLQERRIYLGTYRAEIRWPVNMPRVNAIHVPWI